MEKATCGTLPPPAPVGLRMYVQFHPYREGVETKVCRLLPKVSVVTTSATASDGPEQHGADRHRSAPLAGLESHPDPDHPGRRQSSPRHGGDRPGARCRSDAGP